MADNAAPAPETTQATSAETGDTLPLVEPRAHQDVVNRFSTHQLSLESLDILDCIKDVARQCAHYFVTVIPAGPGRERALDRLDEATMHACAAVARDV